MSPENPFSVVHAPQNDEGKSYENFPSGANVMSWRALTEGIAAATARIRKVRHNLANPVVEIVAAELKCRPVDVFETLRRMRDNPDFDDVLASIVRGKDRYETYLKWRSAILELYNEKRGYTFAELAKKMGVSEMRAKGYLRELGNAETLFDFPDPRS